MNKTKFLNLKELVIVLLLACVETAIALVTTMPFAANLQLVYFLAPGLAGLINGIIYVLLVKKCPKIGTQFIMGYYLVSTTTVSEFVAAMERMRVPQKVVIPVSVVFRFFPTVKEEYAAIRDAMKMRGITTLRSPMKMLEYRVVPLMISIAKIGEELSAAALTRGLGAPQKRTNICTIKFGPLDVFFFLLTIPCWVGFFIC